MLDGAPHEYKEKPGSCSECGNSPVNHFEHYVSNTLAVWSAERAYRGKHLLQRWADALFDMLEQPFLRALAAMPFARFSRDVSRASTYRSQVVWEEAQSRGIPMEQLLLFGRATEVYRARIGGMWHYFNSLPIPRALASEHSDWIDDKFLLKRALRDEFVAVPRSMSVKTQREALKAFRIIGGPAVVKPRSGSRGRHTTVSITAAEDIASAFHTAKQLCRHVVVEECLEGLVCRGTVIGGTLAGFFAAEAPAVLGDGASSVRALIEEANAKRPERVQPIEITEEHERFLARRGFTLATVPHAGERVPLTHRTGRLFGGRTRELLGSEHPKLRAYLERAAAALDAPVVGFDLIIESPEEDPDAQKWGIIEANGLPYIDLHYLPLEGTPSNVASAVWDLWDESMHSVGLDARDARATIPA